MCVCVCVCLCVCLCVCARARVCVGTGQSRKLAVKLAVNVEKLIMAQGYNVFFFLSCKFTIYSTN
jgi:hypothetical protein